MKERDLVQKLLEYADIKIDGDRPWDIQVHNPKLYSRVLAGRSMALGESYMDGWWDVEDLEEFFFRLLSANIERKAGISIGAILSAIKARILNQQTLSGAKIVGEKHYDVGNELYEKMLDKRMNYSCGYWKDAKNLDEAQEAKLDLICRKLDLKPGMTVLDIGCGWGGFSTYASEKYGAKVLGITISREQEKLARERCRGLDVEIRFEDYRNIREQFDRIVSIGMFEHVGYKNYREFMEITHRCLKDNGLTLLHTIGGDVSVAMGDPWLDKYIFPRGMLPSVKQIAEATEGLFRLEDWHNFGPDYGRTVIEWHKNFVKSWNDIKHNYNDRFYRMWIYYLLSCGGAFRARRTQLWQIVFAKRGSVLEYRSVR